MLGERIKEAEHAYGLCLTVHMAGAPQAADCCACRKKLCPRCVEEKR